MPPQTTLFDAYSIGRHLERLGQKLDQDRIRLTFDRCSLHLDLQRLGMRPDHARGPCAGLYVQAQHQAIPRFVMPVPTHIRPTPICNASQGKIKFNMSEHSSITTIGDRSILPIGGMYFWMRRTNGRFIALSKPM